MKTNRHGITALAMVVLAFSASSLRAQNSPTYQIDKDTSRVYIRVDRTNRLGHDHGVEGMLSSGAITLGGAGKLVFDMTTFTADTPQARQYVKLDPKFPDSAKVNENMRGASVLDVARFPQATCVITSMNPADRQAIGAAGRYLIDGQFTLHGVTKPIRFLTEFAGTQTPGIVTLSGWFQIKQTDYGIKPFTAAAGAIGIKDELTIYGELVFRAAQ